MSQHRRLVDLRSDTLTKPTAGMRAAMAAAEVGDDVFGEDPTVNRLQERVAELLGKEAAIFVPSGTMSNQIGVRVHCQPGDELLCEANCHIYNYEQGGFAQLSGVVARTIQGDCGVLRPDQFEGLIRPGNDHFVRTRLVCLENTHNRGSGRVQPYKDVEGICAWAHAAGLVTHLDGARLMNAVVATGIPADTWAGHFDTVSICLSKGLGAPVGSVLAGPRELVDKAHRHRKLFGGGMRQAGVIAAAGKYALDHHIERLADDHARAQRLAAAIREIPGLTLMSDQIDTNLVIFFIDPDVGTAFEFAAATKEQGVAMIPVSPRSLRAVTHLDIDDNGVDLACRVLAQTADALRTTRQIRSERGVYA